LIAQLLFNYFNLFIYFVGPNENLDTKSESVWLNFQNALGDYLRIGICPTGAYTIKFVSHDSDDGVKESIKLEKDVKCKMGKGPDYKCTFIIPFDILPQQHTEDYNFQILHFHNIETDEGEMKSFTGALCPTFEENEEFSWVGCKADRRLFAPAENIPKQGKILNKLF
jgi:hypothetical protein